MAQDRRTLDVRTVLRVTPLDDTADLARAMGVALPELDWFCYGGPHYRHTVIPKRSGGRRLISVPQPRLARAQAWVLREILDHLPTEDPAHGFVAGRSPLSCALPHVGRGVVVNLDLADFFPTITHGRVRGVFRRAGYSPAVAGALALLCTEAPAPDSPRALPQGASTSPALSNQVARNLDRRLRASAGRLGFVYTRYADDLTFSAETSRSVAELLAHVRRVVSEEGFALNPKKGRVQRAGGRQTVTGLVVNERPSVPRDEVRRLRAVLHLAERTGLDAQNRAGLPHFEAHLRGKLAHLHGVDPERAAPMIARFEALIATRPSSGAS